MIRWPKVVMGTAVSVVDRAVVAAMQARGKRERAHADAMPHEARLERLVGEFRFDAMADVLDGLELPTAAVRA